MQIEVDDKYRVRNRKIKLGIMTTLGMTVLWMVIGVSVYYSNAFILLTLLCLVLAPVPVAMCYEESEELFYSDRSLGKDLLKGVGYLLLVTLASLAFGVPLILLLEGQIGPDLFVWMGATAFVGGIVITMVVHAIFFGF